jgi:signal transduction histidine kinase
MSGSASHARLLHVAALARSVSSPVDLETALSRVVAVAAGLRPDGACALRLADGVAGAGRLAAWSGRKPEAERPHPLAERVVQSRAPVLVDGAETAGGRLAYYGVPITIADTVLGVVELTAPGGRLSEDERAVMDALAGHAAVALRTARLLGESERRRRTAEALAEMGRALAESLDADVVAQRIADLVRAQLDAHTVLLYRLAPESGDLVVLAASGETGGRFGRGLVIPAGTGISGLAARTCATVVSEDVVADPRFVLSAPVRQLVEQHGYRAGLGVPLLLRGRVVGVLGVGLRPGHGVPEDAVGLVEQFAGQAVLALQTARAYEAAERAREQAESAERHAAFLAEASRLLGSSLDYESTLRTVARLAVPSLGDGCVVDVLDDDGTLRRVAVAGLDPAREAVARQVMTRYPPDPGGPHPLTQALQSGETQVVNDISDAMVAAVARDAEHLAMAQSLGLRAALVAPLIARGRTLGAISFVWTRRGRRYGEGELALARELAQRAALAMDNARLFRESETRRREAEVLADLARMIAESLELDLVLPRVVQGARDLCGADVAVLCLPDDGAVRARYRAGPAPAGDPVPIDARAVCAGGGDHALAAHEGVQALLAVPVRVEGGHEGLLYVGSQTRAAFAPHDLPVLERLAHHAATALDKVRVFSAEQRARAEAEAAATRLARLQSVTDAALAHLSMDELLRELLERIVRMLGADTAAIFLVDVRRGLLVLRAGAGLEAGRRRDPLPLRSAGSGLVASEGRPLRLDDLAGVQLATDYLQAVGMRALLAVPLRVEGRVLGVLRVAAARPRAFDDGDVTLLQRVGDRAALAIEQARLWEAERAARASAEDANRMKDEFLATLSHELRTPLTAILGWAEVLRRGGSASPAQTSRAIEAIHRNARVQVQLVDDLLDVSRIITGKLGLELRPVTLEPVIEGALEAVAPAATAKGVRLEPFAAGHVTVLLGDPDRLQQVLWNLLSNAVKFTPPGGRVRVSVEPVATSVRVRVEDTGKGIGADFLPHVFERFRQASGGTTRPHGGLGLGLAIVRHLVELHGGTVAVESEGEGKGAAFIVELPLHRVAAAPASSETAGDEREEVGAPLLADVRVLLVDDEADARDLLTVVLERYGAGVTAVASAAEALAVLDRAVPDVIVSDIAMPDVDGRALLRAVRARSSARGGQVPALALSAYARGEDRADALAAGFQAHVSKPVRIDALARTIASLIGR